MIRIPNPAYLALLPLVALLHCGGSSPSNPAPAPTPTPAPTYASILHYTAPTVPSGSTAYHLELASGQDSQKLVLALVGPVGTQTNGVTFFLTADSSKLEWADPTTGSSGLLATNGSSFSLGSPALLRSQQGSGALQVGVFQKGLSSPVTLVTGNTLASVALQLRGSVQMGAVQLGLTQSKQAKSMDPQGNLQPIEVLLGTITAQ